MENESPRIHHRANGKETVLCSKDTTFTFTSARSHFSFLPKVFFVALHRYPQPLSHNHWLPVCLSAPWGSPAQEAPARAFLHGLCWHQSCTPWQLRAGVGYSALKLPWHLNPFENSLESLNDSCNLWRMHTLEHMAHVLTNTVDNVSNDAPPCTWAELQLQWGDQCRPGLYF